MKENVLISPLPVPSYVMGRAPHSRDADGPRELRGVANIRSQNGLLGLTLQGHGPQRLGQEGPCYNLATEAVTQGMWMTWSLNQRLQTGGLCPESGLHKDLTHKGFNI